MNFTIEKNIPVSNSIHHRTKYAFRQMNVGDSFMFPVNILPRVRTASSWFAKRNPEYRFTIKRINDSYARLWRIENLSI